MRKEESSHYTCAGLYRSNSITSTFWKLHEHHVSEEIRRFWNHHETTQNAGKHRKEEKKENHETTIMTMKPYMRLLDSCGGEVA